MRNKILTTILMFTVILGTVLLAWYFVFDGTGIDIITKVQVGRNAGQPIYMYKIDLHEYIENIKNTFTMWKYIFPEAPQVPTGDWNLFNGGTMIVRWLMYVANIVIYITNMTIFTPFKLILYLAMCFYSLFGLSGTQMYETFKFMYDFDIPLLNYTLV